MQRIGSAHEVARAIVWLLSDGASDCTGSVLDVPGACCPLVHNVTPSIREVTADEDYSKRCHLSLTPILSLTSISQQERRLGPRLSYFYLCLFNFFGTTFNRQANLALVRWISGSMDNLPAIFPERTSCRLRLCPRAHTLLTLKATGTDTQHPAALCACIHAHYCC